MNVIQTTLLPLPGQPAALYLRIRKPKAIGHLQASTGDGSLGIVLEKGDILSTDTFFGCFYGGHWTAFTDVSDVSVVVAFRGGGTVRIFEDIGSDVVMLCEYELNSADIRRHLIRFRSAGYDAGFTGEAVASRIFVEVEAERSSEVQSIEFVTEQEPAREVGLSVGLSTFNDQGSQINSLLPAVVRMAESQAGLTAVHLVNHGPAFSDPDVLDVLASEKLRQAAPADTNKPGGMLQTIDAARSAADGSTHHLLLSDHAVFDARLLPRLLQFLRYAKSDFVLGAATLDSLRPYFLHGAGGVLAANGQFRLRGQNTDLTEVGKLWQFITPAKVDYVPWSFCVITLDKDKATALPQRPYFRGDDFIYARDQNRQGVRNLCLPGIAVWCNPSMELPAPNKADQDGGVDLSNRFLPLLSPVSDDLTLGTPFAAANSGKLHLLQNTLFPREGLPDLMYLRSTPPRRRGGLVPRDTVAGASAIRLDPGNVVSTDTFFGCFYRAYWYDLTSVRDVSIVVKLSGTARVRIFEDVGGVNVLLANERFQSTTPTRYLMEIVPSELRLANGEKENRPSRIFIEVEAETATDLHDIDFVSTTAPRRHCTLSIGLCTFNQEAYLEGTLTKVAKMAAENDDIRVVHVINQGPAFKSPVLREMIKAPKVAAIQQRNLGGCGGFTRSLIEEFAAETPATHHLMMDDDIVLDERMILRSLRFLNYSKKEISLGAGMLDGMRPHVSHEIGAFLWNDLNFTSYCRDIDLSDAGQLWRFNTPVKTDYNAWWFCILPVKESREIALPAPIFIRGDDLEYGTRLGRAGVPTISLPGIGVWHEPFHAKASYWSDYYNLRNRLIFASIYSDRYRQLALSTVMGYITSAILNHNYQSAREQMKAVTDFLMGPKKLFAKDTEEVHREVMAIVKTDIPEKMDDSWKLRPLTEGKPRPVTLKEKAKDSLISMMQTGFGRHDMNSDTILVDIMAHPINSGGKRYILTNGMRSYNLRFTPKRWRMWQLLFQAAIVAFRFRTERASVGKDWHDHIATYRDPAWWAEHLDAPGTQPKAVAAPVKQPQPDTKGDAAVVVAPDPHVAAEAQSQKQI